MELTQKEHQELQKLLEDYIQNPKVLEMQKYIQHGSVTTYDHCCNVTRVSYWLNKHLHLHANERILVAGAFLHDFYLYDWHEKSDREGLHGYTHAQTAMENAIHYFQIEQHVQQIISSHMWPLTITKLPRSREALIVSFADKYCSTLETLAQRKVSTQICG